MRLPLMLLVIFFVHFCCVIALQTEFDISLDNLTDQIISRYFKKFRCVTFMKEPGIDMKLKLRVPIFITQGNVQREVLTESFEQGCGGYVIRVVNRTEIIERLVSAKRKAIGSRYNNQRYLFVPVDEEDNNVEMMHSPILFFLPNLAFIRPSGNDTFSILTHTVFDHSKYSVNIAYEEVDSWSRDGFTFNVDIYPDKLKNVYGKKFILASLNYSPFSLIWNEENQTMFDGFETRIVATFVKLINGSWEGLNHPQHLWGNIFPNGTGTGILGSIVENKADFGYGAFYQWFCDDTDCSYPSYQSEVTCLVPRPRLLSGWLTIVLPLASYTWEALIIVYLIGSVFLMSLFLTMRHLRGFRYRDRTWIIVSDSFFTNFRLQLEQIPKVPRSNQVLTVYINIAVFYYFFVAAFWQGGISSILTVPRYEKPINEVEDLLEKWPSVKWGANSNAWLFSIRSSTDPNLVEIVKKFVVQDDDLLYKKTKTRDFGFFIEKLPHGHYGFSDYIKEDSMEYLKIMEGNIYTAFGVFTLPKGSPYLEKFDKTVLWMYDTGLIHKLEVQISLERINNKLQNMIRISNIKETTTIILAIRHIEGPIYIYIGGMLLSIAVFTIEKLISHNFGRNPDRQIAQDWTENESSQTETRESIPHRKRRN